jgi:cation diffusion facilitator CzcD-associated flavoprotein CzcO
MEPKQVQGEIYMSTNKTAAILGSGLAGLAAGIRLIEN